jgi:hypothetical protein
MLSFLQSVTALIGLDKLSGGFAGGKTLACGRVVQSGAAAIPHTRADDLP